MAHTGYYPFMYQQIDTIGWNDCPELQVGIFKLCLNIPDDCQMRHFIIIMGLHCFPNSAFKSQRFTKDSVIYSNKKETSDFHGTVSSIQLRCCNINKPKCLSNVRHTKNGNYLILSSDLKELLNLVCTQLFPLSSGR